MKRDLFVNVPTETKEVNAHLRVEDKSYEVDGFGVNINPKYWEEGRLIPVIDYLLEDLGASLFRLDVFGNSNWVDVHNQFDKSILTEQRFEEIYTSPDFKDAWAMARYLNQKGIKPYLNASGIVPVWMCAEDGITLEDYDSFSIMMVSMLKWAREKEKIEFHLFGPLNETDIGPPEGPKVSGKEFVKVLEVLASHMEQANLSDVKLVVAEQAFYNMDFLEPILASSKLIGRVGVVGMHTYSDIRVHEVQQHLKEYDDQSTRFWMTEYGDLDETGEKEWDVAWVSTRRLLQCLEDGAQGGLVWDAYDNYHDHDEAWTLYGLLRRGRHEYTPKKRYFAAKQVYKFVVPGSKKIGMVCEDFENPLVSFLHEDKGITIVGMNPAEKSIQINISIEGTSELKFGAYFTTKELDCQKTGKLSTENKTLKVTVPGNSIFSFVQEQ